MKQRKRGARRILAGAMAALMVLSVVDVSGWSVMNAKAEGTTVGTTPQYLTITASAYRIPAREFPQMKSTKSPNLFIW